MNRKYATCITITSSLLLAACMNMPTDPAQITSAYTPEIQYGDYSCNLLGKELAALARRENRLIAAQEQRIKNSQMQAFWRGYGTGDGIEASELANVRGESEAVRSAMDKKNC